MQSCKAYPETSKNYQFLCLGDPILNWVFHISSKYSRQFGCKEKHSPLKWAPSTICFLYFIKLNRFQLNFSWRWFLDRSYPWCYYRLLINFQIKNLWDIVPAEIGDRFLSMLPPWHAYERACEYFIFTCGIEQVYTTVRNLKVLLLWFYVSNIV